MQRTATERRGAAPRTLASILAAILLAFAISPLASAATAAGAAGGGRAVTAQRARTAAGGLIREIHDITDADPDDPAAIASWKGASPGKPLLVSMMDGTPSLYMVPVVGTGGKVISVIGVGALNGKWQWYSTGYPLGRFPLVDAGQALAKVKRLLHDRGIAAAPATPEARLSSDKTIYWHVGLRGTSSAKTTAPRAVTDIYLPAFTVDRPHTNLEAPPWRSGATEAAATAGATTAPSPEAATRSDALVPGGAATAHEIKGVPYHQQKTNYWCGPASLEMVFDYWGPDISQTEIAEVADSDPSYGVYTTELARAAQFSDESSAIEDPNLRGYSARKLGYGMSEQSWDESSGLFDRRYSDLKNLVAHDYPVLLLTDYNAGLGSGHFRVVKGYDDRLGTFTVHDPWYTPQPYSGPDIKFDQSFLVDTLWTYSDRWAMVAAPWSVSVSKPPAVSAGQTFSVSAQVSYSGSSPLDGQYTADNPTATLQAPTGKYRVTSGPPGQPLGGLYDTGSQGTASWTVKALAGGNTDDLEVVAHGLVQGTTPAYGRYTDWIGGEGSTGSAPTFVPTSRTWGHDSVGVSAGSKTWYLAEGSTNGAFETWVLVQNPNSSAADVSLTYMTASGPIPGPSVVIPADSRKTFNVADAVPGEWSVSTMVTSNVPVVAERSMYWGNRKGGHDSVGVSAGSQTWYLAEGCTKGGFETWVLVQNPNPAPAKVTLSYMTASGKAGGPTVTIPANSRQTFNVADAVPGQWSVSTMVSADRPVVAERSVYWGNRKGGHDSVGVRAGSQTWYLAEGCTNGGFETWVLVQNPNPQTATVKLSYMTAGGAVPGPTVEVPGNTRKTFNVGDSASGQWSVSTMVSANRPIVAERAVYWANRTEGHDSVGVPAGAKKWYLAEGCTNRGFETWVLVQNPNSTPARVTLTYMTTSGPIAGPTVSIPANSRKTFNVFDTAPGQWSVSTKVKANKPVIAERSTYGDPK